MKKQILAVGILCAAVFAVYLNSLGGTWAMDDILANRPLGIHDFSSMLGYRKITYLTFLFNQWVSPFTPTYFRLFNITLHFLNAVLVYLLCFKTMKLVSQRASETGGKEGAQSPNISGGRADKTAFVSALLCGLFFAVHPLNINAVAYIVQRMTALAAFFVMVSLLSYIAAFRTRQTLISFVLYGISGLLLVMGIFSKENAVMGIPLVLLYDYFFLSDRNPGKFARRFLIIGGVGLSILGVVFFVLKIHHVLYDIATLFSAPNQPIETRGWMATDVYWTPFQHVLTSLRVLARYVFLIFLPLPRFLVFDWWGFPVSTSVIQPVTTLFSMFLLVALLLFALAGTRRWPLLSFGILWYFIAISLETFLGVGLDLYFEHRNYLPLAGLFIGGAGQLGLWAGKSLRMRKTVLIAAVVVCAVFGSFTVARNTVWRDSATLWQDTLTKAPGNLRAMMALGNAYFRMSDYSKAEPFYKEALNISSKDRRPQFLSDSAYTLGMMYLFEGRLQQAKAIIGALEKVVESYRPGILRGFYKALTHDTAGAIREYDAVIGQTTGLDRLVVLTLKGDAYRQEGQWEPAIRQYEEAIALDRSFSAAYYGMGASYIGERQIALGKEYLEKTVVLDPDNILALSDLADLFLTERGGVENAMYYAERALSKNANLYQPYLTMANVLVVDGREAEADQYYKKASEHGMPAYMVPFGKARAYYIKGDSEKVEHFLLELRNYTGDLPEQVKALIKGTRQR